MNRITKLLGEKPGGILSVFFTAGFPSLHSTVPILKALEKAGVDLVEIGIPFSDPIADGPTIQDSNKVALDNGMNVRTLLEQVRTARESVRMPIILMGYLNPVMQFGVDAFLEQAAGAGADGVILPDLPFDEYERDYKALFGKNGLQHTFLVSPTTSEERIRRIDQLTEGFIYAVSASSTTGAKGKFGDEQIAYFSRLKAMGLAHPFLVGFGISNHQTFARASEYGAGAIIGSAFIQVLKDSSELEGDIQRFVRRIKP